MPEKSGAKAVRPLIAEARRSFHAAQLRSILTRDGAGVVSIADSNSNASKAIAAGILRRLGKSSLNARLKGQMSGSKFEKIVAEYVETVFPQLHMLRPGRFTVGNKADQSGVRKGRIIAEFEQYSHLASLKEAAEADPTIAVAIGQDYLIKPDVTIFRESEPDSWINSKGRMVDISCATRTSIRAANNALPSLHAVISCKWTLRSDRAQNARSEALNLIRNRKGRLPHIVVVTGEPMPGRLASLAFGTGDIDCVYHIALDELVATVSSLRHLEDARDTLRVMIEGKRLRDISDLPLDLTI
jgi:hypothetical protein